LPVRLVHWLLAALIAFCWWSAEYEHLDWHFWSGYAVLMLLIFRLLWGFVGSSTARFATFIRGPRALAAYLKGKWRGIGHTPLGALSVVALLLLTAVDVGLGLVAIDDDGLYEGPLAQFVSVDTAERATGLHDTLFNWLLGLIILHLCAILYYRLFRGKRLVSPMITGRAALDTAAKPMKPGKWWAALLCLAIAIGITRWVIAGAPL
jgi:cytochrome b